MEAQYEVIEARDIGPGDVIQPAGQSSGLDPVVEWLDWRTVIDTGRGEDAKLFVVERVVGDQRRLQQFSVRPEAPLRRRLLPEPSWQYDPITDRRWAVVSEEWFDDYSRKIRLLTLSEAAAKVFRALQKIKAPIQARATATEAIRGLQNEVK